MDDPADQTSVAPTGGPERTKSVVNPIVDDLAECFTWMKDAAEKITALELEVKRLQVVPVVGVINASGNVVVDGTSPILVTPVTAGDVTTYTVSLDTSWFTLVNTCDPSIKALGISV